MEMNPQWRLAMEVEEEGEGLIFSETAELP